MFKQKPWLRFYEPHVPESIDYPRTTLPAALLETAGKYPDHPAMIFKDNRISYRVFNEQVDRFAAALQELDLNRGDRVAIHLPNCPQFPIVYYAVLRMGLVFCRLAADAQGGRIWVESAPGEGTTISFRLPPQAAQQASVDS